MTTEYARLETRKMKNDMIEEKLNTLSRKGWRVKCSLGDSLILMRQIDVKEE